jgi:hypothetical protein
MTLRSALSSVLLAASLAVVPAANAALLVFDADLAGTNEVPPNASAGSGEGLVEIDTVTRMMRVVASFMNLTGTTTASHIHCCAGPGSNAGVATQVPTFSGFPLGVTSGTYDMTFDMNLDSSWNPMFIANNGGSAQSAFDVLLLNMQLGRTYLNIHSSVFGGGEIRGQLQKVSEPATLALLLFAGVAYRTTRRRRTG